MVSYATGSGAPDLEHLPGTPWSVRPAAGSGGRPALEIYHAGTLVDVMVAQSLALRILRGARSAVWAGQRCAVAWGCLPADGTRLSVAFTRGRLRPRVLAVEVESIAGSFWIALAEGRYSTVTVTYCGARDQHAMRTARPR